MYKFIAGASSRRTKWTLELEAAVCRAAAEGLSARDAFARVASEAGLDLPPSYSKHAASLLWGLRRRIEKRCENGDEATLAAFKGMIAPITE